MRPGPASLLLAALLLAGCTQAPVAGKRVEVNDLVPPPAPVDGCAEGRCAWEWWNATIRANGTFTIHLPVPVRTSWSVPGQNDYVTPWATRFQVTGGSGDASFGAHEGYHLVRVSGRDALHVTGSLWRQAGAGDHPDASVFLPRWTPLAGGARPQALEVEATGDVQEVLVTYEAHSDLCTRRAAYAGGPGGPDGTLFLPGHDEVVCR